VSAYRDKSHNYLSKQPTLQAKLVVIASSKLPIFVSYRQLATVRRSRSMATYIYNGPWRVTYIYKDAWASTTTWATLQPLDGTTLRFCTARRHLAQRFAGGLEFKSERANHPRRQAAGNALLYGRCKPIKRYLTGRSILSSNLAPVSTFG
jgi:hypothetical protein